MDPGRSSIVGGIVATIVLLVFLLVADFFLGGPSLFVFATFTSLCAVGGPPYCSLESATATLLTYLWFGILFVVVWPLLFAGFTSVISGESGMLHGAVFGFILWVGYAVLVVYGFGLGGQAVGQSLLVVTLIGYLVYGLVLGGSYDYLAANRTSTSE